MRKVIVEHEEVADAQGHLDDLVFEDVVRPELDPYGPAVQLLGHWSRLCMTLGAHRKPPPPGGHSVNATTP